VGSIDEGRDGRVGEDSDTFLQFPGQASAACRLRAGDQKKASQLRAAVSIAGVHGSPPFEGLFMRSATLIDGIRIALTVILVLALVEKISATFHRTARWHPVVVSRPRLRQHAAAIFMIVAILELVGAALLWVVPEVGALMGICLLAGYTILGRTDGAEGCRCLVGGLDAKTRIGMIGRNLLIVTGLVFVAIGRAETSWMSVIVGSALLAGLGLFTEATDRVMIRIKQGGDVSGETELFHPSSIAGSLGNSGEGGDRWQR